MRVFLFFVSVYRNRVHYRLVFLFIDIVSILVSNIASRSMSQQQSERRQQPGLPMYSSIHFVSSPVLEAFFGDVADSNQCQWAKPVPRVFRDPVWHGWSQSPSRCGWLLTYFVYPVVGTGRILYTAMIAH